MSAIFANKPRKDNMTTAVSHLQAAPASACLTPTNTQVSSLDALVQNILSRTIRDPEVAHKMREAVIKLIREGNTLNPMTIQLLNDPTTSLIPVCQPLKSWINAAQKMSAETKTS